MFLRRVLQTAVIVLACASMAWAVNPYRYQQRMYYRMNRMPYVAQRPLNTGATFNEASLLRQAYTLLSTADHDYQGHRIKAMKSIHSAGKALGLNLAGDAKQKEGQGTSDEQLLKAQGLLKQINATTANRRQQRISMHVSTALQHISTALAIK